MRCFEVGLGAASLGELVLNLEYHLETLIRVTRGSETAAVRIGTVRSLTSRNGNTNFALRSSTTLSSSNNDTEIQCEASDRRAR